MLLGITCPFGQLSQSPGYVSDTLLTRSPLDRIATAPCDLHVLTTPPAFRLSQDQTLQLFFLDPPTPPAHRPGTSRCRWARLNGFVDGVIREREFVRRRSQTRPAVVTAHPVG